MRRLRRTGGGDSTPFSALAARRRRVSVRWERGKSMKWTKTLVLSAVALLALVVALTLGTPSAWALAPPTTVDLIAGQHQVVGTVTVTPLSSTSLQVVFQM